mmetsp:Transcript_8138/g.18164  ORF Transcript_8138/g.18164 Transcript_8138/m.18164 type:complete len:442 (-) Transcript_8138:229-1554(-)
MHLPKDTPLLLLVRITIRHFTKKTCASVLLAAAALTSVCFAATLTGYRLPLPRFLRPRGFHQIYKHCEAEATKLAPEELQGTCGVPNPWVHDDYLEAFAFQKWVRPIWRCWQVHYKEMMDDQESSESCEAAKRLVQHGLKANSLGLDFRNVFATPDEDSYSKGAKMNDLLEATKVYNAEFGEGACPRCRELIHLDHDLRTRERPMRLLIEGQRDKFAQFFRDGFTQFQDLGVDVDALQHEVSKHLSEEKFDPQAPLAVGRRLRSLEPIFKDTSILQLASFYMGSAMTVTGYKILRLGDEVDLGKYASGHWHHDGCGSRLKLFVYLDEVKENGHPTEIARGSQTLAYYSYPAGHWRYTRFSTPYVQGEYEVVPMLGPRGGGFMFDTNSVHRGNVDGKHLRRDVIIIDIESKEKMQRNTMGKTCPDQDLHRVNLDFAFPMASE